MKKSKIIFVYIILWLFIYAGVVTQGQSVRFACEKSQVRFLPSPAVYFFALVYQIFYFLHFSMSPLTGKKETKLLLLYRKVLTPPVKTLSQYFPSLSLHYSFTLRLYSQSILPQFCKLLCHFWPLTSYHFPMIC
jgi:hypothetical protein